MLSAMLVIESAFIGSAIIESAFTIPAVAGATKGPVMSATITQIESTRRRIIENVTREPCHTEVPM